MSEGTREDPEIRRKRLRFRSWHRGTRENDLIIGRFVDAHLDRLDAGQLDQLETLLNEAGEWDVLHWITGEKVVPPAFDTVLFRMIRHFNLTH